MFLRFVIHSNDPDSGKRQGIFQAVAELRDEHRLTPDQEVLHDNLRKWFNQNLEPPARFARSTRHNPKSVAISWFKAAAMDHIAKMREMAMILNAHDIAVEILQTDRPGYIVYEDHHQVCAEPFRETKT